MHHHLEIVMPPRQDIEAAVAEVLADFNESADENKHSFLDWWQIGGRYSGSKVEARVSQEKISAFTEELNKRNVTVSGIQWGKQELNPESQIEMVDALWREMCPGGGDVCPIFKHSGDLIDGDVCLYQNIPQGLTAYRLIVAAPDYEDKRLEAKFMLTQSVWNGVNHEDTKWNGSVEAGIKMHLDKLENYREEYAQKIAPRTDWIVVTVDYHS